MGFHPLFGPALRFSNLLKRHQCCGMIQIFPGYLITIISGKNEPLVSFDVIQRNRLCRRIHQTQSGLGARHTLLGRFAKPEKSPLEILRNPMSLAVHQTKVVLRFRITLFSRVSPP